MLRHALALLLMVVFGTVGVTTTAITLPAVNGTHVGVTTDGPLDNANVVRAATLAGLHVASPGPLAVPPDAAPILPLAAAAADSGSTPFAAHAGISSTVQGRAPPGVAR